MFGWPKGKPLTPKHKKKISDAKKGIPKTDAEKAAIKEGRNKGKKDDGKKKG